MSKVVPETVGWRVHYGLFARQGFSVAAQELAAESHAMLLTLEEIEAGARDWV